MTSAGDDDVRDMLEGLTSDDPRERVITLNVLSDSPTGSPEVLARVRELMTDTTLTHLTIPYSYGEVRYAAPPALAAEQRAAFITEPVVLADVPVPLDSDEMDELGDPAHLQSMRVLDAYAELRRQGLIPLRTIRLDPADWPRRRPAVFRQSLEAGEDVVGETLRELASDDPEVRAGALLHLARYPIGSSDVAAVVRVQLDDRTPVGVDVPFVFGELRWAAAHALAAELRVLGVIEPVVLVDVPAPIGDLDMVALAKAAGVDEEIESGAMFAALRERGLLPLTTITLTGGVGCEQPG